MNKSLFSIILLLLLSFNIFSQNNIDYFEIKNHQFVINKLKNGSFEVIMDSERFPVNFKDYEVVTYAKKTKAVPTYDALYLVSEDREKLIYINFNELGLIQMTELKLPSNSSPKIEFEKILIKDGKFEMPAYKITYYSLDDGIDSYFERILAFHDPSTKEFISHYYVTEEKFDKITPIHELDGENVRLFETGDSYLEHPLETKINSQRYVRPTPKKISLPTPPERIKKEFKVLTLDDFSDDEIKKAKEYVGSDDFYKIMEGYSIGSVAILGESGEGKSFLAKQFYIAALAGYIPGFEIQEVLELSKSSFSSNTMYVGQSAEKLEAVKKYFRDGKGKRLIFADEVHTLKGTGTSSGDPVDHLQNLKSEMSNGKFKMLGTTTLDEFNGLVGGDGALERRFIKVRMTVKTHEEIMESIRYTAKLYDFDIPEDLIEKIIIYSNQFDVAGVQPAKAVKLTEKSIAKQSARMPGNQVLIEEMLIKSVGELYNSDPKMLDPAHALNKTQDLIKILDEKVIGLSQAKESLIKASRRRFLGMTNAERPPLRMMLIGPPGVGKSHIAKVYGDAMGFEVNIISMNNYSGHHTADKFLDDIASSLRNNPNAIMLLDEFEKASPAVMESTLQMLNDGTFKQQEKVPGSQQTRSIPISTKNAGFILTSNIGDKTIEQLYVDILKIEMEKTQDIKKAEAEAIRVFNKMASKSELEKILIKLNFNTAVLDRMDHLIAVTPPNLTEFRANIELYTKLFLKGYQKRMGLEITIKNFKASVDKVMTHYKPGLSNRDAQKLIDELIQEQIADQLTAEKLKQKKMTLSLNLDALSFKDIAPKTTQNLKKLVTMHELHGHWLMNFLLYGENVSNFVTIIPGDGYLGYVRPKINHDLVSETLETFTGMFKKVLVLEAGYRAEYLIGGVTGRGAGTINRKPGEAPSDDLGKIDQMYETWINNNFFKEVIENQSKEVKVKFKLQMAEIIREAADYIIKKGISLQVGNEAVEKLLKEGKLHGEWLDQYATELKKKISISPAELLSEALEHAQKTLKNDKDISSLVQQITKKIDDEKPFFSSGCDQYFIKK